MIGVLSSYILGHYNPRTLTTHSQLAVLSKPLDSFQACDLTCDHLIKVLTGHSRDAINWLQDKFSLDLSKVSCLDGHYQPCCKCTKEICTPTVCMTDREKGEGRIVSQQ